MIAIPYREPASDIKRAEDQKLMELEKKMKTLNPVETFEKCSILFKVKSKIPDFERGKARILTIPIVIGTGIHPFIISRIYQPQAG